MEKWISISAKRHKDFENSINALDRHKLDLNDLIFAFSICRFVKSNAIVLTNN